MQTIVNIPQLQKQEGEEEEKEMEAKPPNKPVIKQRDRNYFLSDHKIRLQDMLYPEIIIINNS